MTFPFYGMKTVDKNFVVNGILNRAYDAGGTPEEMAERVDTFVQMSIGYGELNVDEMLSEKVKEFIHARIYSGYVKMVDDTEFIEVLGGVI